MTRVFGLLVQFLIRYPKSVLCIAIFFSVIGLFLASHLQINSKLTALLPQEAIHVKNINEISKRSGGIGYLMVVVQGNDLNRMKLFADNLYKRIQNNPQIRFIYYKNDLEFVRKHALLFLSVEDLLEIDQFFQTKIDKEGARLNPFFVDLLDDIEKEDESDFDQVDELLDKYALLRREYLVNKKNDLLVMLIKPKEVSGNIKATAQLVSSIKKEIEKVCTNGYTKKLNIQLKGRYMTLLRENQTIIKDLSVTAPIAAILIFLSLSILFKKLRAVTIIGLPLLIGIAWTFGATYIIIGKLNLFTVFLVAILLGLGMDIGIHFFKRYLEFRSHQNHYDAIYSTYTSSTGISSVTASLTTAAAFFSLIFTQFKGFNQFGFIAGLGTVLTLLSYLLTFPSTIILYERFKPIIQTTTHKLPKIQLIKKLMGNTKGVTIIFCISILLILLLGIFSLNLKFEYDFDKIGASTQKDFKLKKRINDLFDVSLTPTIVIVNSPEESKQTVRILSEFIKKESKTIKAVRDLYSLVPNNQKEKIEIIHRIKQRSQHKIFSFLENREKTIFEEIQHYFDPEFLSVEMFPSYLTFGFIGQKNPSDRFVLIYPGIPLNDGKKVLKFADELDSIIINGKHLKACSESLILADILKIITKDSIIAISVTLSVVLFILWMHFKKAKIMGLIILPIVCGNIILLGIMSIIDTKLNFINIVAFPMILGIGIDNSVHFYHRYKEKMSISSAFYQTGMAMCLTSLTTVIGFGSLLFAQHKGLQSLGKVAVLGLTINLFATFIILPLILKFHSHKKQVQQI